LVVLPAPHRATPNLLAGEATARPKGEHKMTDKTDLQAQQQTPLPNPDLEGLEILVGAWDVSGGARGRVTYEWMEDGFFLLQRVDLEQHGMRIVGIEIIGHEQEFGHAPGQEIRSRFYDNLGNTLDYVYELNDKAITIWGAEVGSPAYYRGEFSSDANTLSGAWVYPGGGGYSSTMTRVRGE